MKKRISAIRKDIGKKLGKEISYDDILECLKEFGVEISKTGSYWKSTVDGDVANDVFKKLTGATNEPRYRDSIYLAFPGVRSYGVQVKIGDKERGFMVKTNTSGRLDVDYSCGKKLGKLGIALNDRVKYYPKIAEYMIKHYNAKEITEEQFNSQRRTKYSAPNHVTKKITVESK